MTWQAYRQVMKSWNVSVSALSSVADIRRAGSESTGILEILYDGIRSDLSVPLWENGVVGVLPLGF